MTDQTLFFIYLHSGSRLSGYAWLGFVGTSSDFVPPTASQRAPPSNAAEERLLSAVDTFTESGGHRKFGFLV